MFLFWYNSFSTLKNKQELSGNSYCLSIVSTHLCVYIHARLVSLLSMWQKWFLIKHWLYFIYPYHFSNIPFFGVYNVEIWLRLFGHFPVIVFPWLKYPGLGIGLCFTLINWIVETWISVFLIINVLLIHFQTGYFMITSL